MSGDVEGACFRSLSSRGHAEAAVSLGQPGSRLESAFQAAECQGRAAGEGGCRRGCLQLQAAEVCLLTKQGI